MVGLNSHHRSSVFTTFFVDCDTPEYATKHGDGNLACFVEKVRESGVILFWHFSILIQIFVLKLKGRWSALKVEWTLFEVELIDKDAEIIKITHT